jgi:multiple antibiotic resistance protein
MRPGNRRNGDDVQDWAEYSRFALALFAILTPFAAIPIFLGLTEGRSAAEKAGTARAAVLTVFVVLTASALSGDFVLRLLGTSLDAFRVGGGIILMLMAISMLSARVSSVQQTPEEAGEAADRDAVGVVPLGLPLMAGPGAVSTVIIQIQRGEGIEHFLLSFAGIVVVCLTVWALLRMATPIGRRLGVTGLNILNRLFGLLLAAVAAQIVAAGLLGLFPGLG